VELDLIKVIEDQGIAVALLIYMLYKQREMDEFIKEKFCKLFDFVIKEAEEDDSKDSGS